MDLDMPIMGGIKVKCIIIYNDQATNLLTKQMQDGEIDFIPIVACTAHDDKDTQ